MEIGTLHSKSAEVNGTKKNRCVMSAKNASQTAKEPSKERPYSALKFFLWMFSATILRPLTSARNYATIADRKSKIRRVDESKQEETDY